MPFALLKQDLCEENEKYIFLVIIKSVAGKPSE